MWSLIYYFLGSVPPQPITVPCLQKSVCLKALVHAYREPLKAYAFSFHSGISVTTFNLLIHFSE